MDFFQIRGVTPQCTHDYLDVFINVSSFDLIHHVINDQLLHRYCGRNKPPLLVSFTNLLLLGFFTEDTLTERGFNGSFRFLPVHPYRKNLVREPCDYLFNSSLAKRGEFFSSTYPGTYLPVSRPSGIEEVDSNSLSSFQWQFCNYSFVGQPGERVHIRFRDLVLFKTPHTQHCAVDLIKLYDNTLDPPELRRFLSSFRQSPTLDYPFPSEQGDQSHIADLCGTYTLPLDVYSTGPQLLLYFLATHYAELSDDEHQQVHDVSGHVWRKGFYAEYEFLSSLSKLDFVSKSKSSQYLSGTECDQTIKSFGQGVGKVQSPNWPYPYKPQTSCTTYLLGLDDRYTLENIEIEFDQFDIDCQLASLVLYNASRIYDQQLRVRPQSLATSATSSLHPKSSSFSNYYRQDLDFKANLSFCGHFKPEGRFVSKNALLKLSFIPNDRLSQNVLPSLITGGKFQARYRFVKSYHQVSADEYDRSSSTACNLSYYQSHASTGKTNERSAKRRCSVPFAGRFEPPRSSENDYFANSNCTFNFYPINDESRLLIFYEYFNIVDENYAQCPSDNLTYSYRLSSSNHSYGHPFVYCGYRNFPSPYLTLRSTEQFRVHFRSNDDSDAGLGFDARYHFLNRSSSYFSPSCRSPFDSVIYVNESNEHWGTVSSDGYPENLLCEWSFVAGRGFQFHLEISLLEMEGSKSKDPLQGCQSSVLRIYGEGRVDELCGQQETIYYFLTESNWFTLQFLSLLRQTKEPLRGFQLSWTVVQMKGEESCPSADEYFDCQQYSNQSGTKPFCIHRSLICDGHIHCQPFSSDDELPSNCFRMMPSRSRTALPSSASFLRQHLILITTVLILCLAMLLIATVLIFLLIKMKRRQAKGANNRRRRKRFSARKKASQAYLDEDGERDPSGVSMMEQAVTTV